MGKSDQFIFPIYLEALRGIEARSTAFLGFPNETDFTNKIPGLHRHFYDKSLGNWEINSKKWNFVFDEYDLIVCTRCAYFSHDPNAFIEMCKQKLSHGGKALVDWGLGDHWRFKQYKIGWIRNDEHEFAYSNENFLYSCLWNESFEKHDEVTKFWENVAGRFGYDREENMTSVVKSEVPKIVDYRYDDIKFKFLWPDSPQLYIITTFGKYT